jgi:Skp family chaperone for outer membrane proteins
MPLHRKPTLGTAQEIEENFADALALLRSVRRTLTNLLDRVEDGEDGLLKDVGLKTAELETALKRAFEAEERYNAWHEKNAGYRNAAEIDFDALRQELACRLQRLGDCCEGEA